jgi:hypothetical protein
MSHVVRRSVLALACSAMLLAACGSEGTDSSTTDVADTAAADTTAADTTAADTTAAVTTTDPSTTSVAPDLTAAQPTGHIRGTAYTFNTPDPIAGATIAAEEFPGLPTATTGADGSYDIEVPAGEPVTLSITAEGHHSIRVQTFTLDGAGAEIDGVNFQTPTDAIYDGLKALVSGFTGRDPFEGGCVIVTTVGDARMVGMTFAEFIEFHPHGLAGATVQIDPPLATPVYFNDQVLPDAAQQTTSIDGGVLWPNVPPGNYTLSATLPGTEFVTVPVRCEDGWVVNANPVQGLHAIP